MVLEMIHYGREQAPDTTVRHGGVAQVAATRSKLELSDDAKRDLLMTSLQQSDGNRKRAAKAMNISESTIHRWMKDLEIEDERSKQRRSFS